MKRIALTGATGYIGKNFIRLLSAKYNIFCVIRKRSNNDNVNLSNCSIVSYSDEREIYDILDKINPDVVVHLAGVFFKSHNSENIGKMIDCNIRFSTVFIDAAAKAGCRRIINTGSYWQNYSGELYNPVNLYAATKQAFEDIIRFYQEVENISVITLTIFDTYGPEDNRKKVLNSLISLRDGDSIDMSSGNQKMFFCYIDDVIKAYDLAIERLLKFPEGIVEKYSVRSDIPVPLKEVVNKLLEISGKNLNINWGALPDRKREIENPEGIGEILPEWKPDFDLDRGLKLLSESYRL